MSNFPEPFIRFRPVYQTRVWGGRRLEEEFGRELPDDSSPFGESWEISDREEADCEVASGALRGKTLHELWADPALRGAVFGAQAPEAERFPLLCKVLDARDRLSLQVHPPAGVAERLGGEPKTEVWYIAHAEPGAKLYVGLRNGVTAESFREAIERGEAEACVHAIRVKEGDHLFIPSGRLHAIGAGLVIYEIQQNSDTTYRVYDWNRVGMDGKPRELHVEESLMCIDFDDVEPTTDAVEGVLLVDCPHFRLEKHELAGGDSLASVTGGRFAIVTVVSGELVAGEAAFVRGDFFLVPENATGSLEAAGEVELLLTTWPGTT